MNNLYTLIVFDAQIKVVKCKNGMLERTQPKKWDFVYFKHTRVMPLITSESEMDLNKH